MFYKIEIRRLKARPIVAIRSQTPPDLVSETLGRIYAAIGAFLAKTKIEDAGPPFTRYHSVESEVVDLEGGLLLQEPLEDVGEGEGEGGITGGELPAGLAAVTVHTGDFDGLGDARNAVTEWVRRNDKKAVGGTWEVYLTDPSRFPDPAEWKTEVFCVMQ